MQCSNYQLIRLLCHAMKVFKRVIDVRLWKIVSITLNQCGFVKGCGTTDAIHTARLLLEKHREKNKPVHMPFLDLEKAFDCIPHKLIWHALWSHNVPEAYVWWIQLLYCGVTSVVRCAAGMMPSFAINVGVHQGSVLSPLCSSSAWTPSPLTFSRLTRGRSVRRWRFPGPKNNVRNSKKKPSSGTIDSASTACTWTPRRRSTWNAACKPTEPSTPVEWTWRSATIQVPPLRHLQQWWVSLASPVHVTRRLDKWWQVIGAMCDHRMRLCLKSKIYKTVGPPSCPAVWIQKLADDCKARASSPRHGNANASLEPSANTPWKKTYNDGWVLLI